MNTKDDGGPAFPSIAPEFDGISSEGQERWINGPAGGMSLRDAFAMNVVGHIVGAVFSDQQTGGLMMRKPELVDTLMAGFASVAYGVADSMLEARK